MPSSWYPTSGIPADTVGADGDFARDAVARIDWGPKGRVSAGSWAGTAIAINGPTGLSIQSGVGAPGSQLGQNGQSYFDAAAGTTYFKANNAWAAAGTLVGPQGVPGLPSLTSQSANTGQSLAFTAATTLSSTPTTMPLAGTAISYTMQEAYGTALMGAMIYNSSTTAATYSLVDVTNAAAPAVVYSVSVPASSQRTFGQFTTLQYPMQQGNQFQWQVTGTGSASNSYLTPQYLKPSMTPTFSVGSLMLVGRSNTASTYTGTYNALYVPNTTTNYTWQPYKACSLYYVTCYNQTSGSLVFGFANFTANNFLWQSASVPANTKQSFGPFTPTQIPFAINSQYYWSAAGPGTGAAFVDSQIISTAA